MDSQDWSWMTDRRHLILDENKNVVACSLQEWAAWFEKADRHVAKDYVQSERYGMIFVSTVFLGIPHPPSGELFETMIFREKGKDEYDMPPPEDLVIAGFWGEMTRYHTWTEAEAGHAVVLAELGRIACRTTDPDTPKDS